MCFGNGWLRFIRSKTSEKLELCFYNYGILVSNHPWKFVSLSLLLTLACCTGLLNFHQEKNPMKLWIPPESEFKRDTDWFMSGFGEGYRIQTVMLTAPDVLQPHVLQQLVKIRNQVVGSSQKNVTWEDVCFRVPVVQINKRRRRSSNVYLTDDLEDEDSHLDVGGGLFDFEPSVHLPKTLFCTIVSSFSTGCYEHSILEFWKYDEQEIESITKEDIIFALNQTTISPVLGLSMEYTHLLGGIVRNESGIIVSASSVLSQWMVHVNFSAVDMELVGNDGGTADWATGQGMIWEQSFLDTMENVSSMNTENGTEVFYEASRSFGDISSAAMFQDILKIACGVFLTFFFVLFVLSKVSCLEARVIPAAAGMACVGLAFLSACGLCSALGIFYGPVHTSLPFLLMGIGVDDMFVIMACRNHLTDKQKRNSLPVQIGLALRHAGVSITVTSFTDIVASTIGGTTILPALESFCLYAAAGVFFTFIYQATFFVAFLVLDEHRIEKRRNPFILCITHKTTSEPHTSVKHYSMIIMNCIYSKMVLTKPFKVLIIIGTFCFCGFCMNGVFSLRQQFDPKWFLPSNSYLVQYLDARDRYYADSGQEAFILLGQLNYTSELKNIHKLVKNLRKQKDVVKDVNTWYEDFRRYVNHHFEKDVPNNELSEEDFSLLIGKFLFSPKGGKFQKNFRFSGKLECGEKAPPVTISTLDFKFRLFSGPEEAIPAMNRIKDMVRNSNISSGDGFKTVWSKAFATWTTDEVIQHELYRNLTLSVICVMATTTLLILNISACFWIFICVLLTLVDICGMMFYWGLTVDIVSCIALVLGVGLCIDYAAHVGQTFLYAQGSRHQRALHSVNTIGAAVLNGGLSTLLALSMLSLSDAYIFQAFFKIFFLVVTIGLFHGIVFLPVILSLVGPDAHRSLLEHGLPVNDDERHSVDKEEEMVCLNGDKNTTEVVKDSNKNNKCSY
ncbi:NPC intracellular cholesterol transporter 1-like [Macrosteles quadrilineatus]|uniref:NPC intracellular cholesterol transporter 1-like n=1 Tax=Macrosteles quadrilineatus TaxID=74068 RepID=UPI0023E2562C|nr:NPC intracellular cholesterol transporter 1-like [Macrosteles quadrilineatus]